jgi:hypothetical protein
VPVDEAVLAMAQCDGQHLGQVLPSTAHAAKGNAGSVCASATASTATQDGATTAARRCSDRPCGPADPRERPPERFRHRRRYHPRPTPARTPKHPTRAALRCAVLARDRHCRVPRCSHSTFVDVHHVQPRSEGGRNEPDNLPARTTEPSTAAG